MKGRHYELCRRTRRSKQKIPKKYEITFWFYSVCFNCRNRFTHLFITKQQKALVTRAFLFENYNKRCFFARID